jgi:hypothetical protein
MRLLTVNGRLVNKPVNKYLINWNNKSRSLLQFKTKQFLKPYWENMIVYEEFPVYGSLLKVDILNATLKVAIEVHGPQHNEFHYFHNGSPSTYLAAIKNDIKKSKWLEDNKFKLIEINFDEVDLLSHEFFCNKFNFHL